jgi:sterol desaturase/sphingolipid hydroxylase (fatty acid hydroxylase superfamily)
MIAGRGILDLNMVSEKFSFLNDLSMVELALPLLYVVAGLLLILEHYYPARVIEKEKSWYMRALIVNALVFMVFLLVDTLWLKYLDSWSLFSLGDEFSAFMGAFLAYFIFTFVVYWWHRLRHASAWVWRVFHQLHHSPKRIETLTAYYIHPFDMLANLLISNSIVYVLLGLGLEGAAWYTLITGVAGFLIHANLNFPYWIGYVFQTPRMHRLHHKSGHHAQNYSDIVFWDMIFGTYENPKEEIENCGFSERKEKRLLDMLLTKEFAKDEHYYLNFSSYAELLEHQVLVESFVECYKKVFQDTEVWNESYTTQEVHERLKEELQGEALLRLCLNFEDEVIAFAWVQVLDKKKIYKAIHAIAYYQEIGSPNISKILDEYVAKEEILYLHDLGVKKECRGEVSLRKLLCPLISELAKSSGHDKLFFWTIEKTKISILAKYIGFKKVAKLGDIQFFMGNLNSNKMKMICDR